MNYQGLYWPNGCSLFRHRSRADLRVTLRFMFAAMILTGVVSLLLGWV
jgi:hypothetical protein